MVWHEDSLSLFGSHVNLEKLLSVGKLTSPLMTGDQSMGAQCLSLCNQSDYIDTVDPRRT